MKLVSEERIRFGKPALAGLGEVEVPDLIEIQKKSRLGGIPR